MNTTLIVLNASGDLRLTWDASDPEKCAEARRTVADLHAQGYSFFLVDGNTPADEVTAGAGALVVRRLDPEEVIGPEPAGESPAETPAKSPPEPPEPPEMPAAAPPRRRGRLPKAQTRTVVAVRPLQGG